MRLEGARATAMRGESVLPGKTNYLLGRDPSGWQTDIPTYRKVRCNRVYPGVDLVYYGNQKQLEYDLVVAPGADPASIILKFEGAERLTVDRTGSLVVRLSHGTVQWRSPLAYQMVRGQRLRVASRFVLIGRNRAAFAVGRYDRQLPLVIDPVFVYSTYFGGHLDVFGNGIAIDRDGSAYVTGQTNYDLGAAAGAPLAPAGYVVKLDATGRLVYATYIGLDVFGAAIAVNGNFEAHVVGNTTTTKLPVVHGFQNRISNDPNGPGAGFLMKINAAGNGLLYSTYIGGSDGDFPNAIALGRDGTAYVAGRTLSADFPTVAPFQSALHGYSDGFVARIDTTRSGAASLLYSTFLGGSLYEGIAGIAVDADGEFYVGGITASADFPTVAPFQSMLRGRENGFVSAFSADGSRLLYSTYLGGAGYDAVNGLVADAHKHVYLVGQTGSLDFPVRNPIQATFGGSLSDAFSAEIDCSAVGDASLVYSTYLGGSASDYGFGIGIDVWGNACITGYSYDGSANPPNSDVFVAKIRNGGGSLLFGSQFGGSTTDDGLAIAVDASGNAYVTGITESSNFPVTPNAYQNHKSSTDEPYPHDDAFILCMPTYTKLDFNGDAFPDLLFQNRNDGRLIYWLMRGDVQTKVDFLDTPNPGANWRVVGSADLNGDGETDLIFQDSNTGNLSYWLMNRTHQMSVGDIVPKNPGANWQAVGVADIDRDGYADIVFQNSVSGDIYVWFLRGPTVIGGNYLPAKNPGAGWKVVAVGDLNNDGQPDIVFQNSATGNIYVWYLRYGTLASGGFVNPPNPGPGWSVAGLTDIDRDGRLDLLFQNASTGQVAYWLLNGLNVSRIGFPIPSNPGSPWKLVGR
jgi:hypothetical protein